MALDLPWEVLQPDFCHLLSVKAVPKARRGSGVGCPDREQEGSGRASGVGHIMCHGGLQKAFNIQGEKLLLSGILHSAKLSIR